MTFLRAILRAAALAACLLPLSLPASAQSGTGDAMMLVAKPDLAPPYSETVLLVAPLGNARHVGFILNRPLDQTMASLFPDLPPAQKAVDPVRFGGPVMPDTVFAVAASPEDPDGSAMPLFGDVKVVTHADVINRILEDSPNDARYFIGFVGWQPGELDAEIARGFWYVMDPQPDMVFRREPRGLWKELVDRVEAR